ncbi:GL10328 [Drosophila persimilis]|uniref:GL10328 n=1 Tax=Drosophila persimilis TaxID=7234 RepID=B4H9J0_DROPE|nr:GL10328 [Drosophila persimilis]
MKIQRQLFLVVATVAFCGGIAQAQQQQGGVDPAYLRQYYQQLQQQQQQSSQGAETPIYEQNSEQTQQYVNAGQQIRLKDTVAEQIRAQQQQGYVAPAVRDYLQQPQAKLLEPFRIQFEKRPTSQLPEPQGGARRIRDQGHLFGGRQRWLHSHRQGHGRSQGGLEAEVISEPTDIVVKIPTPPPATKLLRAGGHQGQREYSPSHSDSHSPGKQQYQHQQQQQPQYHQYQ